MSQLQDKQFGHFVRETLQTIAGMMDFTGWLVVDGLVEGLTVAQEPQIWDFNLKIIRVRDLSRWLLTTKRVKNKDLRLDWPKFSFSRSLEGYVST